MLNYILLVAIILIAVAMVITILLQRSEGGALGMSGGGPGNFMSARGTGDLLSRTTQILAGLFFTLCLAMTLLGGHHKTSIVNPNDVGRINPGALPVQQPAQSAPAQTQPVPAPTGALPSPIPAQPAPAGPQDLFGQSQERPAKH